MPLGLLPAGWSQPHTALPLLTPLNSHQCWGGRGQNSNAWDQGVVPQPESRRERRGCGAATRPPHLCRLPSFGPRGG